MVDLNPVVGNSANKDGHHHHILVLGIHLGEVLLLEKVKGEIVRLHYQLDSVISVHSFGERSVRLLHRNAQVEDFHLDVRVGHELLLTAFEHLRSNLELLEHLVGSRLIGLLFVLNSRLQLSQVLVVILTKEFASLLLSFLLQITSHQFSEITSVAEDLDERFFSESIGGSLLEFSNNFNSLGKELIFRHLGRVDSDHLSLRFFLDLNFLDRSFLNNDGLLELGLVNGDALVRSE